MSGNGSTAAALVACHHQAVPPLLQDAQHALGCSDHSHNRLDNNYVCEYPCHSVYVLAWALRDYCNISCFSLHSIHLGAPCGSLLCKEVQLCHSLCLPGTSEAAMLQTPVKSSLLVRVMSLWLLLAVIQLACANGTFIVIAIAATPFPVISNVLVILFTFFCLFHLFAVIFNLTHLQRRKSNINKPRGVKFGIALLQGIALFFFLVTLACYVMAGAGFSYIINTQRDRGVVLELDKVILPAALGITGFGLRMLSKMWWSTIAAGSSEGEEEEQSLITANGEHEPA